MQWRFYELVFALWLVASLLIPSASAIARAEDAPQVDTSEERAEKGDLTEINKQLTNPVSELWSITFQQNNFRISPGIPFDQGERWSSNLLFQPVLPIALTPEWNLITRPVIPLFVSQPHPQAADPTHVVRTTAFSDIILAQMLSPSSELVGNWLFGLGPTWMFPSGTSMWTSSGKWQVGPAALVGYLSDKWILGAFLQNWTSFGGSGPKATNSMNLQPVAAYFLPDGWSIGYSGNILADWKASAMNAYTVPIGLSVAKVLKLAWSPSRPIRSCLAVDARPSDKLRTSLGSSVRELPGSPEADQGEPLEPREPGVRIGQVEVSVAAVARDEGPRRADRSVATSRLGSRSSIPVIRFTSLSRA